MLCQHCGKNPVTTYILQTINGKTKKVALCSDCARQPGYAPFGTMKINNLFGSIFGDALPEYRPSPGMETRCEGCGASFSEIAHSGKAGCGRCYTTFYDRLLPTLEKIHGKAAHVGKTSALAGPTAKIQRTIEELNRQLQEAVKEQNYEEAARVRDRIAEEKKKVQTNGE